MQLLSRDEEILFSIVVREARRTTKQRIQSSTQQQAQTVSRHMSIQRRQPLKRPQCNKQDLILVFSKNRHAK